MKIKDLLESAVGYIAKNKKEASDPRYSMSVTQDIKPNEVARQAKKFGNTFPPPVIHSKAAKNSTPNKLMNLGLTEAEDSKSLQKNIITTVRQTTDTSLLQKVLDTLNSSGLEDRLIEVLSKDIDTKKYIEQIANIVIKTEGTTEEKSNFVENYKNGFIDTSKMLDGSAHSLSDIITDAFALKVFLKLATIKEQGVGPGEIALGVLSPDIKWVGQKGGGGDIIVDGNKVEVKGRLIKGGRWFDARKAKRDENDIYRNFEKIGIQLGNMLNVNNWIELRNDPKAVPHVKSLASVIAKSNFKYVDTNNLVKALISGDKKAIDAAYLEAGYNNYKHYSGFDGLMLLDVGGGNALQYFKEFDDMRGKISYGTIYMYGPSTDAMPQVVLNLKASGIQMPSSKVSITPSEPVTNKVPIGRKPAPVTARKPKLTSEPKGVGRSKR